MIDIGWNLLYLGWHILYIVCTSLYILFTSTVPRCTLLYNSTEQHCTPLLTSTVSECTPLCRALITTVPQCALLNHFKSKTFNIIFSLIFILGCLIYSSALFINFYWYWMLRPQICFIWSCLLCQSLHHYHRKIISLISKVKLQNSFILILTIF